MSLPYSEQTSSICYSLQNLTDEMRLALIKKITDQPIDSNETVALSRIEYALSNPTPLKPIKK